MGRFGERTSGQAGRTVGMQQGLEARRIGGYLDGLEFVHKIQQGDLVLKPSSVLNPAPQRYQGIRTFCGCW